MTLNKTTMNLVYVRAAILENTGVDLDIEQTKDILVEEGLLTRHEVDQLMFTGYSDFYPKIEDKVTRLADTYEILTRYD